MHISCASTRIGPLCVATQGKKALFVGRPWDAARRWRGLDPGGSAEALLGELKEYLSGRRTGFTFRPVYPAGGFSRAVLLVVSRIPRGSTMTYGEVAAAAGRPGAARAVGRILNRNPVPILIPCHRVVGKNWVGGYGLGLGAKLFLLALEGALTPSRLSPR